MQIDQNFSSCKRDASMERMAEKKIDLLILGGGLNGVGIALDAVSRGLETALVTEGDFFELSGTLKTPGLYDQCKKLSIFKIKKLISRGKELNILHNNFSHGAIAWPVILPIFKKGKINRWATFITLFFVDILTGKKKEHITRWVKKKELIERYPFFNSEGLMGAFLHYEHKINDNRLIIETIKKATELGTTALNYVSTNQLILQKGKDSVAQLTDKITGKTFQVKAQCIINTADLIRLNPNVFAMQMVFAKESFPVKETFCFYTKKGSSLFAVPHENVVVLMTSKRAVPEKERNSGIKSNYIECLLNEVNHKFNGLNLTQQDIISYQLWSPENNNGKNIKSTVNNEGRIFIHDETVEGYRQQARQIVDRIMNNLGRQSVPCKTKKIKLAGSGWDNAPNARRLRWLAEEKYDQIKETQTSYLTFAPLFYRYGKNVEPIIEQAYKLIKKHSNPEQLWLTAETWYAVNYEMTCTLSDFFIRRTQKALFEPQKVKQYAIFVAEIMAQMLNWSTKAQENELFKLDKQLEKLTI